MSGPYILSIDQGTTASTALILDLSQRGGELLLAKASVEFPQHFPHTGWVEHDLEELWQSVVKAVNKACSRAEVAYSHFKRKKLSSIGVTNQRETACFFDRETGVPLRKAIVWQCKRSIEICRSLKEKSLEEKVHSKTGLFLDPYFSASKISWVIDNDDQVARALKAKTGVFGTIDSFLIHRLTAGRSFATEPSNASRTLLFDIKKGGWDPGLFDIFTAPHLDCLAEIKDSADQFGSTKGLSFLPDGIPITGVLGDQQAALAGQTCFAAGQAKCTYGTGAFLLMQCGEKLLFSKHRLLSTVAWSLRGQYSYALEGSAFIAGAAIQFLRDKLNLLGFAAESESAALNYHAAPDLYFVPALSGLGAPWWQADARGAIFGLTRGSQKGQLIRAALEGIAFQVGDLLEAMRSDANDKISVLRVDGGASANRLLMQSQADLSRIKIENPAILESTGLGAGFFAAIGRGLVSSLDELKPLVAIGDTFLPRQDAESLAMSKRQLSGWKRAIKAVQSFSQRD